MEEKSKTSFFNVIRGLTYALILLIFIKFRWFNPDPATKDCWVTPSQYHCEMKHLNAYNISMRWQYLFQAGILIWGCALLTVLCPAKNCNQQCVMFVTEVMLPGCWICVAGLLRYSRNGRTIAGEYARIDDVDCSKQGCSVDE